MPESSRSKVLIATSNLHKVKEAEVVLSQFGIKVEQVAAKGIEIQSNDIRGIASYSARAALETLKKPALVEDAGLFIHRLNGFPGPYSSYVFKTIGLEGILKLMKDITDRKAEFRSAVAFAPRESTVKVFVGSVRGEVGVNAKGGFGFGFDPIFIPKGYCETFAELGLEEKCRVSHRGRALRRFAKWYLEKGRP